MGIPRLVVGTGAARFRLAGLNCRRQRFWRRWLLWVFRCVVVVVFLFMTGKTRLVGIGLTGLPIMVRPVVMALIVITFRLAG